ncbi:MAG: hypothetical protein JSR66_33970 [Proteobacteria bacterium]|nr:hypothetical protein [Pseudomonadota bacterium]
MATRKKSMEPIARAAAEGVAIALAARQPRFRKPIKIICGIPAEVFQATIAPNRLGGFTVTGIQAVNE